MTRPAMGHTLKQLQFIGFGAATSYYLGTFTELRNVLMENEAYTLPWYELCLPLEPAFYKG